MYKLCISFWLIIYSVIIISESRQGLSEVTNGLAEYIESQSTLIQQSNLTPSEGENNGELHEYDIPQNAITPQDFHPNSPFLENAYEGADFRFDFTNDSQAISLPQCDNSESFNSNNFETEHDMERRHMTMNVSSSYLVTKTTDDKISYKPPIPKKPDTIFNLKKENSSPVHLQSELNNKNGDQGINEWFKKDQEKPTQLICSKSGDQGGDNCEQPVLKQSVDKKVDEKMAHKSRMVQNKQV